SAGASPTQAGSMPAQQEPRPPRATRSTSWSTAQTLVGVGADDLAPLGGGERLEDIDGDRALDESDAAVAHAGVDAAGVLAAGDVVHPQAREDAVDQRAGLARTGRVGRHVAAVAGGLQHVGL